MTSAVAGTLDRESVAEALVLKPPALLPWTRHWVSLTLHVLMELQKKPWTWPGLGFPSFPWDGNMG